MRFTLRDLAAPLFRRRRTLMITFACVFVAAALVGFAHWHVYETHMVILVGQDRPNSAPAGETPLNRQDLGAEADLLRSRDLLQQVVLANGMQNSHHFWLDLLDPGQTQAERVTRAVQGLAAGIDLETSGADLIGVTYRSPNPALAYDVLNSVSKVLLEKHAQSRSERVAMEDAEAGLRALEQEPTVPVPADRRRMENSKAAAGKPGSQSLDESAVQREAQADERDYLQYLAVREQARVAKAHGKTQIGQVAIAIPPARPVLPAHGAAFILLIAFASAAWVSFPITYTLDYFDPSFHTPTQVTEILRVPVVVAVPKRTA